MPSGVEPGDGYGVQINLACRLGDGMMTMLGGVAGGLGNWGQSRRPLPPPYQGGGACRWVELDRVPRVERSPPVDGGGREGVISRAECLRLRLVLIQKRFGRQ